MAKEAESNTALGFGIGSQQLQEILSAVVKAAKEPNEYEKKKLDDLKNKELAEKVGKEVSIIATHAAKMAKFYNCAHEKEDGSHNFVAQAHADGLVKPVCQTCGTTYPPFKALPDMISSGVNLQSKDMRKRLKKEHLLQMHQRSFPDCKLHCCNQEVRDAEARKSETIIRESARSITELSSV